MSNSPGSFDSLGDFRTIALIGKYQSLEIADALRDLVAFLQAQGREVLIEEGTAAAVGCHGCRTATFSRIGEQADLAIVVGGDGTMLNAARRLAAYAIPLAGVNQGRLGFMTDIASQSMLEGIASLLDGEFSPEQRFLLDARVMREGETLFSALALNDVVINKGDIGRMIEVEVRVDGEFIYILRADGMIIATPTGSTAYALSANGPILHPAVHGVALVPLCPHALSNRPITISDESRIEIQLLAQYDARIHFDGHEYFDARAGDLLQVQRSSHAITLMHPPGYSYFAMLREKLHWSGTPRH
ncbi:putative inorganic polyphosphate/ATP-NAD kinase [Sterolibacterium denitrificans]|uniref:NAD kinase n=1 Tax=Sterolibacterium denitrificans TaxID=157592 RepID=A0A7Z7HRA1_9PROT|nr:NAD kinase [Sterolibacterium denitrificans]SMB24872.1 putative inorganic polyphosphate/ATP-NAD kinase [Sterolibacterium denitrificans]